MDSLISQVRTYLSDLDSPTNTLTEADIDSYVSTQLDNADYKSCISFIESLTQNKGPRTVEVVTDQCLITNTTSPQYLNNACCNPKMLDSSCCLSSTLTVQNDHVFEFKNPLPSCDSNEPSKVRQAIRHYYRVDQSKKDVCEHIKTIKLHKIDYLHENLKNCPTEIFERKPCVIDDECFSGSCLPSNEATPQTKLCAPASHALDSQSNALAKCIKFYLTDSGFRVAGTVAGIDMKRKELDTSDLQSALVNQVGSAQCVNEHFMDTSTKLWWTKIETTHNSQTACEGQQSCSDGTGATCSSTDSFCGAFCGKNGVCKSVTSFTSKAECDSTENAIGTCFADKRFHRSNSFDKLMKRTDCTEYTMCSVYERCGESCTEVICQEEAGYCFKFPFSSSRCVLPYEVTTTRPYIKTCQNGTTDVGFGCSSSDTSSECRTKGGRWTSPPSSQEACEKSAQNEDVEIIEQLYLTCNEGANRLSSKYKTDCSKCSYRNDLLFRWVMGSHTLGKWTKQTEWKTREVKNLYRWTNTIDSTKYSTFISNVIKRLRDQAIKSYGHCALSSSFDNMRDIACSCSGSVSCFTSNNIMSSSFWAFPGAVDEVDLKDAQVLIHSDSIATEDGATLIQLNRQTLLTEPNSVGNSYQNVEYYIYQKGEVVGALSGDGVSINYASTAGIDLCIRMDPHGNHTFDGPKFGYQTSEGSFEIDDTIVIHKTGKIGMICGTVKQANKVYYPVLVATNKYVEKTSDACMLHFSVYTAMIFAVISLLVF